MKIISTLITLLFCISLNSQENFNLELLSNVSFGNEASNDIWGYVAPDGTEYAVIGNADHTRVFELSDPENPREVAAIAGNRNSVHRDIKSNGEFVYVTCDQGADGLLIIDMRGAPDNIEHVFWQPTIVVDGFGTTLSTCHNLYIDENSVCYLAGCSPQGVGGVIMLDIVTDPMEPQVLGIINERYSHDVVARGDTLYSSEIGAGIFTIYDVSDKENYTILAQEASSFTFTHNAWMSDDGNYLFTTDERGNAFVDAYDISDINNITRVDMFQPLETAGNGVIPHNTHFINDYLVTSWYTDGVVITDVSQPDNMIKVGSYDTWLGADGGFSGCWGVYPWLPSGIVIASDINSGLYVFRPNYQRAAFLEGNVTDASTGISINEVEVIIQSAQMNRESTNAFGDYKTGIAQAGTYDVIFSHPDYISTTLSATIVNGEITVLDAQLEKLETFIITGQIISDEDETPLENGRISFTSDSRILTFNTDVNGNFTAQVFSENYAVVAGAWGYQHVVESIDPQNVGQLLYRLPQGYMDDFVLDLDWSVDSNANAGIWERGVPVGTNFNGIISNIDQDNDSDIGNLCYVTGNAGGGAGNDDVDDGSTRLISEPMNLSNMNNPVIKYEYYFFNDGGFGAPNDELEVALVINGAQVIEVISYDENTNGWSDQQTIIVKDFVDDLNANIQIMFTASDNDPGHLVEAAIDVFRVEEGTVSSSKDLNINDVIIAPNPFDNNTKISFDENYNQIEIYNILGKRMMSRNLEGQNILIGEELQSGIYFVKLFGKEIASSSYKIIKQ